MCVQSDDGSRNRLHREPMLAWRRRWRWTRDNRQEESGKEKTGPLGGPWHTRQLANDTDGPDEGGPPGPEKCCAIRLGGIRNEDSTRTRTRPATAHGVKRPRVQPRAGPVLSMQETRRDTNLQADGHQPNRLPDSETQQAMDLQKQPEPFATAPALGSTDLRPSTNSQMSDSLGAAPLAQFAPASLTPPPPGAGAGRETGLAIGGKSRRRKRKAGDSKRGTTTKQARSKDCGTLDS